MSKNIVMNATIAELEATLILRAFGGIFYARGQISVRKPADALDSVFVRSLVYNVKHSCLPRWRNWQTR